MRNWGIAITGFYALVVVVFLFPAGLLLLGESWSSLSNLGGMYTSLATWVLIAILVGGQALLLFLSVDASHRRLRPRQHVLVSITLAAFFIAILTFAALSSVTAAAFTEGKYPALVKSIHRDSLVWWMALWLFWAGFFYLFLRDSSRLVTRLATWMLRGSVLELLIVIPCHLIVRQRDECTSPMVTSFGVVTGVAVMLLSFGPGVLLLYKKRLDQYQKQSLHSP